MFAYKCNTPSLQWCQEQFSNVSSSINHFWKYCSKLYTDVFMTCFQMVHGAHILFAIATLTSLTSYFSSPSSSKRWLDASTSDCFREGLWNATKYLNILLTSFLSGSWVLSGRIGVSNVCNKCDFWAVVQSSIAQVQCLPTSFVYQNNASIKNKQQVHW